MPALGKDGRMGEMKDSKSAKNALLFSIVTRSTQRPIVEDVISHSVPSTIVHDECSKECPEWSMKEKCMPLSCVCVCGGGRLRDTEGKVCRACLSPESEREKIT